MTDAALRALEREARARPSDLVAGWTYAVGLERAGERRALWLELCRLARAGDARAVAAVDGWLPGLGGTTPRAPELRAPRVARVALIADEALESQAVWWSRGSPTGALLVLAGSTLLALDPLGEGVLWRRERVAWCSPWADDALVVSEDRTAVVRSASTGQADLGAGLVAHGPVHAVGARSWGDRLVLHQDERLQLFDVGAAFGQLLWRRPVATDGAQVHADLVLGWANEGPEFDLVALDLTTGERRWTLPVRPNPGPQFHWNADEQGLIVCDRIGREPLVSALDLATGAVVWSGPYEHGGGCVALGPRACVFEVDGQLVARARADGRPLWTAPTSDPDDLGSRWLDLHDRMFEASLSGAELRLVGLSLDDGARLVDVRTRLPGCSSDDSHVVAMLAHAFGVDVVMQTTGDRLVVVRFAD